MKFFIYYRPLETIRFKEYMGDLIHLSTEEKEYSPDGKVWKIRRCNRPQSVYTRLVKMLAHGGMESDMVYPLDGKRSVRDLVNYMNKWENK
ncbi:hypothetical protein X824_gp202 [Escherichia phage 4MG]|uniref:Hyphothetical protein n=1 Tax=Escherichia phage 4MG TaxID=1391428 RepID=V5KSP2_9CAUD|nr:hypothetical protein X824_gp202 [Escherichia phage 4MG]AGZ17621.1 hyphothetical protein [Escherichia phage 4MG]